MVNMLKKAIASLPISRLIIYLVLVGLLPLFVALVHASAKRKEWDAISQQMMSLQHYSANSARKQALNRTVRTLYGDAEHMYLENQLEPLGCLKKEKEALEHLLNSPTFTGNEAAEKRYAFLSSRANHIEWVQGSMQAAEGIQQADLLMAHPIEVDAHDLKEILARIEGNRKGKPQLIITDFRVVKKGLPNANEVFELSMKLLKREFSP
jgi:hypothetical protein